MERTSTAPTQKAPPLPPDWNLLIHAEDAYLAVRNALEREVGNNVLLSLGKAYHGFKQAETAALAAQQKVNEAKAMRNARKEYITHVKKAKKPKDDKLEQAKKKLWKLLDEMQEKQNLARMALHKAYKEQEAVEAAMVEAEDATGNSNFVDERVGRPGPVGKPYRAMASSFSSEDATRIGWDGPSFE